VLNFLSPERGGGPENVREFLRDSGGGRPLGRSGWTGLANIRHHRRTLLPGVVPPANIKQVWSQSVSLLHGGVLRRSLVSRPG
jgi:hypothetical protein